MTLIMRSLVETFDLLITCPLEGIRFWGAGGQLYSTKSRPLKGMAISLFLANFTQGNTFQFCDFLYANFNFVTSCMLINFVTSCMLINFVTSCMLISIL